MTGVRGDVFARRCQRRPGNHWPRGSITLSGGVNFLSVTQPCAPRQPRTMMMVMR